jgi:plastocyanin
MKRAIALLFACLALGLVAAGCGGGDDNGSSDSGSSGGSGGSGSSGGTGTKSEPAPAAKGGGGQVTMKDIKFNPATVTVKAGDTVTWTNDDSVGHDVTADAFDSGDAGGIEPGATFNHKFPKAGTYSYVCTVHPGMKGTVKVKK